MVAYATGNAETEENTDIEAVEEYIASDSETSTAPDLSYIRDNDSDMEVDQVRKQFTGVKLKRYMVNRTGLKSVVDKPFIYSYVFRRI